MPAKKTLRSRLVKLFYRIIDPKHPRGWIEIDWEELPDGRLRLFSEGLDRYDLPDLEILDCPYNRDILGYCHGILYVAIGALQQSKSQGRHVNSDDTIDLRIYEEGDPIRVRIVESNSGLMRIKDIYPKNGKFPKIAVTNYILNAAENMRRPHSAIQAINLVIELETEDFKYEAVHPNDDEFHGALILSNARTYYTLCEALYAVGKEHDATEALEEAIARAPFFAEYMAAKNAENNARGFIEDYLSKVDPWEVQARFRKKAQQAS